MRHALADQRALNPNPSHMSSKLERAHPKKSKWTTQRSLRRSSVVAVAAPTVDNRTDLPVFLFDENVARRLLDLQETAQKAQIEKKPEELV